MIFLKGIISVLIDVSEMASLGIVYKRNDPKSSFPLFQNIQFKIFSCHCTIFLKKMHLYTGQIPSSRLHLRWKTSAHRKLQDCPLSSSGMEEGAVFSNDSRQYNFQPFLGKTASNPTQIFSIKSQMIYHILSKINWYV